MTGTRAILFASAIALAGSLSACGGGSGSGTAFTPAPPRTPTPPTARQPLVAPELTAAPQSPVATPGGPTFNDPQVDTEFPLVMTAEDPDGGDQATTEQGGTIAVDAETGQLSLTLNNSSLGVVGALDGATLSGGRTLLLASNVGAPDHPRHADLDYARYGIWDIHNNSPHTVANSGAWLAGYVTPAANVPVSGTAVYRGSVTGSYLYPHEEYVFGNVEMTADFGAQSIEGAMTEMWATSGDAVINGPINDIGFTASIDPSSNLFVGTTRVISMPVSNIAFGADATGSITGRFFGPSAQEAGAVWTLQDGTAQMIGSFGARR